MPDREFQVIGVIDSGTPLSLGVGLTLISLLNQDPMIIESAKEHCADGIIIGGHQAISWTVRRRSPCKPKKVSNGYSIC